MRRTATIVAIATTAMMLGGCVRTVGSIVTAPFKVAGQAADWATTSQDEADRNSGRKARKAEADAYRKCKREAPVDRAQCMNERLTRRD